MCVCAKVLDSLTHKSYTHSISSQQFSINLSSVDLNEMIYCMDLYVFKCVYRKKEETRIIEGWQKVHELSNCGHA